LIRDKISVVDFSTGKVKMEAWGQLEKTHREIEEIDFLR